LHFCEAVGSINSFRLKEALSETISTMEALVLSVKERESVGTGPSKRIRAEGRIPVNFYGPSGNRELSVDEPEFRNFWKKVKDQTALFEIEDEKGKRVRSLVQEVQTDAISKKIIHVDIREIAKGIEINAHVAVHPAGTAYGVKNEGGVLEIAAHELEVRCLPRNLPSEILVDVTELHVHDSIHVRDLVAPKGVTILNDGDEVVIACAGVGKPDEEEATEDE
jgi:large subunit ribosomal protein L25